MHEFQGLKAWRIPHIDPARHLGRQDRLGLIESPISLFMLILAAIVFGSSVYAEVKNKKAAIASEVD